MQNPQFMSMAERLGSALMQDPSVSQMLESLSNPWQKDQFEERMACVKKDPSLKPILKEIESGGPAAMMRYWNYEDVVQKLGEAMGLAVPGDADTSAEASGLDETDEAENEDESIVHHTASVGDVEPWVLIRMKKIQREGQLCSLNVDMVRNEAKQQSKLQLKCAQVLLEAGAKVVPLFVKFRSWVF